ncbi:MAG TPA: hypothetical protein VG897_06015, partial [Terriglobales bacterium]|nr:hypothetical protein [Terriglobales bacterium]
MAFARLLDSAPSHVERATDLQRMLDLDTQLGWQIFRLASATEPFSPVQFIPGPGSVTRVLRLAKERGFHPSAVEEAEQIHCDFLRLVAEHAGDRETFDAMIAGLNRGSSSLIDTKLRRNTFRMNVQIWGAMAKVRYDCVIYSLTEQPGVERCAVLGGFLGLRRLREIPAIPVMKHARIVRYPDSHGDWKDQPGTAWEKFSLINEFCSTPLPDIQTVVEDDTSSEMLQLEGIGKTAEATCFAYNGLPATPPQAAFTEWGTLKTTTVPVEVQIIDLLVPRGLADLSSLRATTFGKLGDARAPACLATRRAGFEMPIREPAQHLGVNIDGLHDRDLPCCADMVRHVLNALQLEKTEFDIFRCRVSYPILSTAVELRVDAAKK